MKTYLDNLRPFEKRLVVGVGIMVFIVFNAWFVVPHFGDWDRVKFRMAKAQKKLADYNAEIAHQGFYKAEVTRMEGEGASTVQAENQSMHFQEAVQTLAAQSGVALTTSGRINSSTNDPFFLTLSKTINLTSHEQQLVDFLFNLGSGTSQIRVRNLELRPDGTRMQLVANITLVASYQKNTNPQGAASTGLPTARLLARPLRTAAAPSDKSAIPTKRP